MRFSLQHFQHHPPREPRRIVQNELGLLEQDGGLVVDKHGSTIDAATGEPVRIPSGKGDGKMIPNPRVKQAYLERFPDDPDCLDLANWHAFEQDRPDTFRSMYQFWCRKPA